MAARLPQLRGLSTVLPSHRWTQQDLFQTVFAAPFAANAKAEGIFANAAVQTRHFSLDLPAFCQEPQDMATRSLAYLDAAMAMGREACLKALEATGLKGSDIDFFVVASCTGFAMPDLDVLLGGDLGLKRTVHRLTIGETGSHAGIPAIARALDHVYANPRHRALVLVVEVSSANLQLEPTGENVVSAAIFADGATAMVVEGVEVAGAGLALVAGHTSTYFETASEMTYRIKADGLHFHLGRKVPEVLESGIGPCVDEFLAEQELQRSDISRWISHPGGRLILDRIEAVMGFTSGELAMSRHVLATYGNMAAATVFFVLAESIAQQPLTPGERLLLLGYGPGLAIEVLMLQA
jgi:alkylresorcinol/alkylpyrone synthase